MENVSVGLHEWRVPMRCYVGDAVLTVSSVAAQWLDDRRFSGHRVRSE